MIDCCYLVHTPLYMLVINIFIRVSKFFIFYDFRKHIIFVGVDDGLTFGSGLLWPDSLQRPPVERNWGKTVLYSLSDPQFKFYIFWEYVFRPYWIVGKDFFSGNNVCWKIVTLLQERLNRDHHWVYDISEVCVILHFLHKNISWIDNAISPKMWTLNTFLALSSQEIFYEGNEG